VTERTNIEVVQAIYAAMAAKDIPAVLALVSPDIVLTQDERLPWGGRFEGHDGFATFGLRLVEAVDSAVTIDSIFEADDEVVQMGHTRGTVRSNGVGFDIAEVHRWRVEGGLAVWAHFAIDTPGMLAVLNA
jgi:ketosteroid isomerase-like protein